MCFPKAPPIGFPISLSWASYLAGEIVRTAATVPYADLDESVDVKHGKLTREEFVKTFSEWLKKGREQLSAESLAQCKERGWTLAAQNKLENSSPANLARD